jgi:hypothetical protein
MFPRLGRTARVLAVGSGVALTVGCGHDPVPIRVLAVPTATPGVEYVVVRPGRRSGAYDTVVDRNGAPLQFDAEYVLLCDGRGTGALKCGMPPEVNDARVSFGPAATSAPAADFGTGTLAGVVVEEAPAAKEPLAAGALPASTVPAPPPPVTLVAPAAAAKKEKKK